MGICWQNVAYNQPPHLGYYLPDYIESFQGNDPTGIVEIEHSSLLEDCKYYNLNGQHVKTPQKGIYIKNGKQIVIK
jgi:hypothetical protein